MRILRLLAVALLLAASASTAGAQSAPLQASLELETPSEIGGTVRLGRQLGSGAARVRVRATNLDARRISVDVRIRFRPTNPLALDEILDSISVESATRNGLELSRNDLQIHGSYLNSTNQPLAYRFTLYRILNGGASVRVRVYGAYLE